MAEIHGCQTERIAGLADIEFALIQFYLHFQHIVSGLQTMLMGALNILHQFYKHGVVLLGPFLHLFGFDDLRIGLVCFHDNLRGCQRFVHPRHFFAQ